MYQLLKYSLLIIISLLFFSVSISNGQPSYYKEWLDKSTSVLMEKGLDYLENNKTDSALVCFGIVSQRYNKDLPELEKKQCCYANLRMWFIYFSNIYNYSKSYEKLLEASDINDELKEKVLEVDLGFAYFWNTMYFKFDDINLGNKAISYYKKCFDSALSKDNAEMVNNTCVNMLNVANVSGQINEVRKEYEIFVDRYKDNNEYKFRFTKLFGEILYDIYSGKYEDALDKVNELEHIMPVAKKDSRFLYELYNIKTQAYDSIGDYRKAYATALGAEKIAVAYSLHDKRMDAYNLLSSISSKMGNQDLSEKYLNDYYQLKDSVFNYKQLESVNKMTFGMNLKKMEDEIEYFKTKNKIQKIVFSFMAFIMLLIIFFSIALYKKIRELNTSNRDLYDKNLQIIEQAETESRRLKEQIETMEQSKTDYCDKKYKNSSLDDDSKAEMLNRILNVMNSAEEIYSVSFSAERLSDLSGINYKYISQVINEKYDCNFNIFLNKYRIEEACRRLSNIDEYGNLTVEAIAEGVGFKSRSAFSVVFKKITGLTPVNYRKIAIERHNTNK